MSLTPSQTGNGKSYGNIFKTILLIKTVKKVESIFISNAEEACQYDFNNHITIYLDENQQKQKPACSLANEENTVSFRQTCFLHTFSIVLQIYM